MKLRSLLRFVGLGGGVERYGYEVETTRIDGAEVRFARWKHPRETPKALTPALVEGYRAVVREGDFCIDVGAHTGDTSVPMALAAGRSGCVLALEPNPYIYHVLEKNARANAGVMNLRTLMAAAGPSEGFMRFEYSDAGFCNGGRHEGISAWKHGHAFKLDVFAVDLERELRTDYAELLPRLRFIKTDAEGYDLYVLRALEGVLREFRPVIKAEVFKRTSLDYRKELLAYLRSLGYVVRRIVAEPLVPGAELTEATLDPGAHYDVLATPADASAAARPRG